MRALKASKRESSTKAQKPIQFKPNRNHTALLIEMGKLSAERSIKENKVLGLPITYSEEGKVIREHADGRKEVLGFIENAG